MPLAVSPLGQPDTPESEVPKIYSQQYRHSIVDSSWQPEQSLLTLIDGIPRRTEFYLPFLGADEEPAPFAPSNAPTYQQYTRISDLIIWQDGNSPFNFDPQTAETGSTFNAWWVVPGVPPIIGSPFIADIGDGNAGLFAVTEQAEPKNITANKGYLLTCQFQQILTKEYFEELNSRVVREWTYSKDSALVGGSSVVSPGDYKVGAELFQWGQTIANHLLRTFYWNPERTIAWVDEDKRYIYDQYLVNFICAVIPGDYRNMYPTINQFSTEYGSREFGSYGDTNIWEVLLRGDFNLLGSCKRRAKKIEVTRLVQTRMYGNLRSSKFGWFIATDPERYPLYKEYYSETGTYPILAPSREEEFDYIFSENFYKGVPEGEFENIVVDIVKHRLVDHKRLLDYCKTYFELTPREQLYNGAILMMLLQAARRLKAPLV